LKGRVKTWADDLEADIRNGTWTDPRSGRMTVDEWWTKWSDTRVIERSTRDRDASHYRNHVKPRWGAVPLQAVTSWDIDGWIASMVKAGVGAPTVQHAVRLMRHLMSEAQKHRLIRANPVVDAKIPKAPKHVDRFLTRPEWELLAAEFTAPRDLAMACLMCLAGLRWEEVAGLHHYRVDLPARRLIVVEVKRRDGSIKSMPKSSAGQRYVPIVDELAEALEPLLRPGSTELVFPGVAYTNWRRRVFLPAVEGAKLAQPFPTIHDLRHTFGSWLAEAGVPPTDIMALMGHGSLRATERYMHSYASRFDRAVEALSRPMALPPAPEDGVLEAELVEEG
jgi:integrase